MFLCKLIGMSLNQEGICVKVRVPEGPGGGFSASTVLGGSVTQQVNLIAEERRRATE